MRAYTESPPVEVEAAAVAAIASATFFALTAASRASIFSLVDIVLVGPGDVDAGASLDEGAGDGLGGAAGVSTKAGT